MLVFCCGFCLDFFYLFILCGVVLFCFSPERRNCAHIFWGVQNTGVYSFIYMVLPAQWMLLQAETPHIILFGFFSNLLIEQNTKMLKCSSWVTGLLLNWKQKLPTDFLFFFLFLRDSPRCVKYGLISFFLHAPNQDIPSGTNISFVVIAGNYTTKKKRKADYAVKLCFLFLEMIK